MISNCPKSLALMAKHTQSISFYITVTLKRAFTILITAIFFITSSGVVFGQHVCMGIVKSKALYKKASEDCEMPMMAHEKAEDCCHDEWLLEKIEDHQQISLFQEISATSYHLLYEVSFKQFEVWLPSQEEDVEAQNTDPPDLQLPSRFILYKSLKIPFALQS